METKTFAIAAREFFGYRPGQDLKSFAEELRALSPKDREDLKGYFRAVGIEVK
jgi:hypothetical protein